MTKIDNAMESEELISSHTFYVVHVTPPIHSAECVVHKWSPFPATWSNTYAIVQGTGETPSRKVCTTANIWDS